MTVEVQDMTIGGRPALVLYINDKFEPVDEADATAMRVIFIDEEGGTMFMAAKENTDEQE